MNVSHLSPRDQWEFLTKYAKHFEWPGDEEAASESAKSIVPEKATKSRKAKPTERKKLQVLEKPRPTLLFLNLGDTRDVDAAEIPGITPCWNHQIYVELSRDVPLDPAQVRSRLYRQSSIFFQYLLFPNSNRCSFLTDRARFTRSCEIKKLISVFKVKPPLAKWKQHRWLDWATRRGLVDASEYFVPIRHLLIVSPLREFNDDTSYSCDESEDFTDEESSPTALVSRKTHLVKTASPATTILRNGNSRHTDDISIWGDFNKLSLHLREVELFYRKKFFKHSIEISNIVSRNIASPSDGRKSKTDQLSTRDGRKSAAKSVISVLPTGTYEYREKMLDARNEALFLFVDSTEEKFFLVDLSTMARETKKSAHLVAERHDWFHQTGNELIAELTTRGTKSTVFKLEAGRHLLRIFVRSESFYNVSILSDTAFHIGERLKIHGLMTSESMRVQVFAEKISNSVKKAFGSFGTDSYGYYLRLYYQSYTPDDVANADNYRKLRKSVHSFFRNEFAALIKGRFPLEESKYIERCLRIFFLDPSIGMEISSSTYQEQRGDTGSREIIENSETHRHRAAVLIQSAFRMFLVRRYKKIHNPLDKEHNQVKEALARVAELFDYDKRETVAGTLLRSTLKSDAIFGTLYKFSNDLINVIRIQELKGQVQKNPTRSDKWIPIVRVVINAPKREIVRATLDLFANLSNYTVRVFANDTKREMPRLVNSVAPARYRHREGGYTVFAYGWSDSQRQKDIEWTLHLTTIKGEPMFRWLAEDEPIPAISEVQPLLVQEISNTYVPNIRNRIAKISLRIGKTTLVSLMLRTSYEKASVRLRVIDEAGSALSEVEGVGVAVLPVVFLEFENSPRRQNGDSRRDGEEEKSRKSKRSLTRRSGGSSSHRSANASRRDSIEQTEESANRKLYFVEASLRDEDSWPLTEAEWSVVAEAKSGGLASRAKSRKSSTLGRISKTERPRSKQFSKKSLDVSEVLLEPYWTLQIVTDGGNELEMSQDRSEETKIEELKRNLKTEESDRSERGRRLRGQFLEENSLVIAPSAMDMIDDETRTSADEESRVMDSAVSPSQFLLETGRTLKPPANLGNYLPKLDLTIYMVKEDEEETCWVKSEYDEETLRNQRAMNVLDFGQLQSNFIEEYADLVEHRRRKHRRLSQRCTDNYNNRTRAVEEAYEARQAYVDSTKSTAISVKSTGSKQKKTT